MAHHLHLPGAGVRERLEGPADHLDLQLLRLHPRIAGVVVGELAGERGGRGGGPGEGGPGDAEGAGDGLPAGGLVAVHAGAVAHLVGPVHLRRPNTQPTKSGKIVPSLRRHRGAQRLHHHALRPVGPRPRQRPHVPRAARAADAPHVLGNLSHAAVRGVDDLHPLPPRVVVSGVGVPGQGRAQDGEGEIPVDGHLGHLHPIDLCLETRHAGARVTRGPPGPVTSTGGAPEAGSVTERGCLEIAVTHPAVIEVLPRPASDIQMVDAKLLAVASRGDLGTIQACVRPEMVGIPTIRRRPRRVRTAVRRVGLHRRNPRQRHDQLPKDLRVLRPAGHSQLRHSHALAIGGLVGGVCRLVPQVAVSPGLRRGAHRAIIRASWAHHRSDVQHHIVTGMVGHLE
mmetsp:Transcript_17386/g.44162  ORF Transcript_17386/g.44162 Transcript_17386/m.44162 type:complete len:397 (+) Transcript_17386:3806-4996(+)